VNLTLRPHSKVRKKESFYLSDGESEFSQYINS